MRIWNEGGFFQSVKGHVVKWWQSAWCAVLRINNNGMAGSKDGNTIISNQESPIMEPSSPEQSGLEQCGMTFEKEKEQTNRSELARQRAEQLQRDRENQLRSMISEAEAGRENNKPSGIPDFQNSQDPMEVLKRIEQEKEERKRKEIEQARKQAQEQERIASIMNANKVDVNAFIAAGRAGREEAESLENEKKVSEEEARKQEEMRRAQEIIDRLNREAAEDEAKKLAQIDEAKRKAKEKFG